MKRLIALLLALSLMLALISCGRAPKPAGDDGAAVPEKEEREDADTDTVTGKPDESPETDNTPPRPDSGSASAGSSSAPAASTPTVSVPDVREDQLMIFTHTDVSGEYDDGVGNHYSYSYRLPVIKGPDTDYVARVNASIEEIRTKYVDESLEMIKEGVSLYVFDVNYYWSMTDGLLSVLIVVEGDWDITEYYCFNITEDGREADNQEVLERADPPMSPEELYYDAWSALYDMTDYSRFDVDDPGMLEFAAQVQEKTLSWDNLNYYMPVVLDGDGHVLFVVTVYSLAGADSYDHLLMIGSDLRVTEADPAQCLWKTRR